MLPGAAKPAIWDAYGAADTRDGRGAGPSSDRTVVESSAGMVGTSRATTRIEKGKGKANLNASQVHRRVKSARVVEESEKENEEG